jgi:hypothetical protein
VGKPRPRDGGNEDDGDEREKAVPAGDAEADMKKRYTSSSGTDRGRNFTMEEPHEPGREKDFSEMMSTVTAVMIRKPRERVAVPIEELKCDRASDVDGEDASIAMLKPRATRTFRAQEIEPGHDRAYPSRGGLRARPR